MRLTFSPLPTPVLLAAALLTAACDGCGHAPGEAPGEHSWRELKDPYPSLGAPGAQPSLERAARVLDAVGAQLGYAGAGDEFRRRRDEPWVIRETLLLAHGGDAQVEAAWIDALGALVEGRSFPPAFVLLLRQSEARITDAHHAKVAPDVLRRMHLAELAWVLHLLSRLHADAGLPAPRGF